MNTNMTWFRYVFFLIFVFLCLMDKSSLSIGRVRIPFIICFWQRDITIIIRSRAAAAAVVVAQVGWVPLNTLEILIMPKHSGLEQCCCCCSSCLDWVSRDVTHVTRLGGSFFMNEDALDAQQSKQILIRMGCIEKM